MSNYPPGVTGGEFEIAGPDYEEELDEPCPECGQVLLVEQGYRRDRWVICCGCRYQRDLEPYEPDPDRYRD